MRRSLHVIIITITVIMPAALADNTMTCNPGHGNRALKCLAWDTERDDMAETMEWVGHKVRQCSRIEKLLADPQNRKLMMQEPEGRRTVRWYAGNCPLGKSKG
jgi:hypothetical protein